MIVGKIAAIYRNIGTHNEPVWERTNLDLRTERPMHDGEALLAEILANPGEDTPRLVYADWLDENGQAERAEFVRVQCWLWANPSCGSCTGPEWSAGKPCQECDKREAYRERQRQLWNAHAEEWLPTCIGAELDHCDGFCRGFLEATWMSAELWFKNAAEITAQHPIRKVRLTTMPEIEVERRNDGCEWAWFSHRKAGDIRPAIRLTTGVRLVGGGWAMSPEWVARAATVTVLCHAEWPGVKFTLPTPELSRAQLDQITTDVINGAHAAGRASAIAANERVMRAFMNPHPAREYRADNVSIDPPTEQE